MRLLAEKKVAGIALPVYVLLTAAVLTAMWLGWLPDSMIGALLVMMTLGGLFHFLGENIPVLSTHLGGGTIVCIFGAAALTRAGLIPGGMLHTIDGFLNQTGFLDFFIASLIAGSMLSMNRRLLIRSAVRFLPVAFMSMGAGIIAVLLFGKLFGYEMKETLMFIAIPMMSGGMGAGVVPLSGMYAEAMHVETAEVMSRLMPASAVGNVSAILMAGILAGIGNRFPKLTGNGWLLRGEKNWDSEKKSSDLQIDRLFSGLVLSLIFYLGGVYLNRFLPVIHTYAWMILLTAGARAAGIIPEPLAEGAGQWSSLVIRCFTNAVLIGIGSVLIDLDAMSAAISPSWLMLVIIITVAVTLGAAAGGYAVGFYPIESAITAGLCTINMGGSGNIAILSASKRMELLAFAQLATRICGSLVLVLSSILIRVFL